jgi:hypothetical protein
VLEEAEEAETLHIEEEDDWTDTGDKGPFTHCTGYILITLGELV